MAKALHSLMRKAALAALVLLGLATPSTAAKLYISEFPNALSTVGSTQPQVYPQAATTDQTVALSGSSAISSAFGTQTKAVQLICDEGCSVKFGTTTSTAATTSNFLLQQGVEYNVTVAPGSYVAAIANAAGNTATGSGGSTNATIVGPLGQQSSAGSVSVALSSDGGQATAANQTNASQKAQIVDGSGNVVASTNNALNAQLYSAGVALTYVPTGQATMALSIPMAIASDQSAVPIVGNVSAATAAGISPIPNTSVGNSVVLKASGGNLYGFEVAATSALGLVEIFNATAAPADGAVTPVKCYNVASASTIAISYNPPLWLGTGGVVVFSSSTTCFTKTTGVNTAFISGDMK